MKSAPWVVDFFARRWLGLANAVTAIFLGLPFLAPVMLRAGRADLANVIYSGYQVTCHEWPFRAYFLFGPHATYSMTELEARGVSSVYEFRGSAELGYKVAFCERNVAIYVGLLLAGLLYAQLGARLPSLSFRVYLLALLPMAVDGLTQLAGLRESTWELRTLTGLLFGIATVLLIYPRLTILVEQLVDPRPVSHAAKRLPA